LGMRQLVKNKNDRQAGIWITVTFFTVLLSAIFLWRRNVGAQYIFFLQPFVLILSASGVYLVAHYLQKHIKKRYFFIGVIMLSAILLPNYGYFMLENNSYHITAEGEQANYRKVFDYIKRHVQKGDVMITRNFRNYYWSGLDIKVYDFGSERSLTQLQKEGKVKKITLSYLKEIIETNKNHTIWMVFSDNDKKFITKEVRNYLADNFKKVNNSSLVRGKVSVYSR